MFFLITHTSVKQNWAHAYNFKKSCGPYRRICRARAPALLLNASQSLTYILHPYVAKYIKIMNDYIKALCLRH